MNPAPVGTRIRVIECGPLDDYRERREYVVDTVDPSDGTFRARDAVTGRTGGWLHWRQVEPMTERVGFDFVKRHLAPETVLLLEAFDGVRELDLRADIRDRILLALPNLAELVREEAEALAQGSGARLRRRKPRPTDDGRERRHRKQRVGPDDVRRLLLGDDRQDRAIVQGDASLDGVRDQTHDDDVEEITPARARELGLEEDSV